MRPHVFLALSGLITSLIMLSVAGIAIYATVQVYGGWAAFNLVVTVPVLCAIAWGSAIWACSFWEQQA